MPDSYLKSRIFLGVHGSVMTQSGHWVVLMSRLLLQGSETAPVLLWLQGGPGSTSLFGLFAEHGPYVVYKNMTGKRRFGSRAHARESRALGWNVLSRPCVFPQLG